MDALLVIALQGALIAILVWGSGGVPKGAWNDEPLSLAQSKSLQGLLALGVVFHHCAQKIYFDWSRPQDSFCGLEVMAFIGFAFVGYFFFCSGYGLCKSCQKKQDYLDDFPKRRILPLVLTYYVCNTAYLVGRLVAGESFDAPRLVRLALGVELANPNSWFVVTLPVLYLLFYLSKRGCTDEARVTRRLFLGTGVYVLVGIGMALANLNGGYVLFLGKWWYNTAILFPLGYLFGRKEAEAWAWMKRGYRWQVVCSIVLFTCCFLLSIHFGTFVPVVPLAMVLELLAAVFFTWGLLLFSLRRKVTSQVLAFYGGLTLELYLAHGFFVNLFHEPFYDKGMGIVNVGVSALYILLVLACATPLASLWYRAQRAQKAAKRA